MSELRKARKAGCQSGQRKLFPVRLVDFATLRDLGNELASFTSKKKIGVLKRLSRSLQR